MWPSGGPLLDDLKLLSRPNHNRPSSMASHLWGQQLRSSKYSTQHFYKKVQASPPTPSLTFSVRKERMRKEEYKGSLVWEDDILMAEVFYIRYWQERKAKGKSGAPSVERFAGRLWEGYSLVFCSAWVWIVGVKVGLCTVILVKEFSVVLFGL